MLYSAAARVFFDEVKSGKQQDKFRVEVLSTKRTCCSIYFIPCLDIKVMAGTTTVEPADKASFVLASVMCQRRC